MELISFLTERDTPSGTIVVTHGYAEHHGRFMPLIDGLVDAGYDVFTYDLPGHGTSPGPRARVDIGRLIAEHIVLRQSVIGAARTPDLFLFGHSMGGLITAGSMLLDPLHLRGVVLSGPALRPLPRVPAGVVQALLPLARVCPALPISSMKSRPLSRDPRVIEEFDNDPLCYHGAVPLLTGATMAFQGNRVIEHARWMSVPLLILQGSKDVLVDPAGAVDFIDRVDYDDARLHIVEGAFHEVLNEPEGPGLIDEIITWLSQR